ncbi:MAG TPA: nucleotidyltransferase domain-containing protein [Burkholderiaceae bacterium]|nr:nucleotidyltransferase domain-containing protein [Burkholderiaceae bacterium]
MTVATTAAKLREVQRRSGIDERALGKLLALFDREPGLEGVWLFGSRAKGDFRPSSDIDLAVDLPHEADEVHLRSALDALGLLYRVDVVRLQSPLADGFRAQMERDRQPFWLPRRAQVTEPTLLGLTELKDFQTQALTKLDVYLAQLNASQAEAEPVLAALAPLLHLPSMAEAWAAANDHPKAAWNALRTAGQLPPAFAALPHSSRFDGAGRAIPNVCFKVPTGGGKTLLAAASVGKVCHAVFRRSTGLVLWVVPKEAIYRQTLKALKSRDHPYRQMLNVAGAGRVKILEKDSPLSRLDTDSHLCVMVLMLASAARASKETLRFFRDRGNVHGFFPPEDDVEAHWQLLAQVPNLDVYAPAWAGERTQERAAQKGSIVKSSLGNVMRVLRPMVILDEGQYGYTPNALHTIDGFNPGFVLELSATPRVASAGASGVVAMVGSNLLVDVRGTDLEREQMIKLPIQVDVRPWSDWQSCLAASVAQLQALQQQADAQQADSGRYIRPILLVQVERTGKDQVESGHIHARHVRTHLAQLGFGEDQIREKTSEKDELGDEELLLPTSRVRVIITKQALQEGWDCSFAYVLCALAASKGQRALTQLVGRILRMPQVARTAYPGLNSCYVFCHDASTGEVAKAIKSSLEGEGMGDLVSAVQVVGGGGQEVTQSVALKRRAGLEPLRLFLPTVTWVESDGQRRPLIYESDVLAQLPWQQFDPGQWGVNWVPAQTPGGASEGSETVLRVDLSVLSDVQAPLQHMQRLAPAAVQWEPVALVRELMDIMPNPWLLWDWLDTVVQRLQQRWGMEAVVASAATLTNTLRRELEGARDQLAQQVFDHEVQQGRIEFCLRADALDFELPHEWTQPVAGTPQRLAASDGLSDVQKSLLVPALHTPDMNAFEVKLAGYLDQQAALRWWHRNVAKTQYGLQGWKRHKVYPDFVFGLSADGNRFRVVVLETKGMHLDNDDTAYKQSLLQRLTQAYRDQRFQGVGSLALEPGGLTEVTCDLVFDQNWAADLDARYFSEQFAQKA